MQNYLLIFCYAYEVLVSRPFSGLICIGNRSYQSYKHCKGGNMGDHQRQYAEDLFTELSDFERKGVDISLDGWPASPMQVVNAHIMRENIVYMRDYIMNENGDVKGLGFHNVKV